MQRFMVLGGVLLASGLALAAESLKFMADVGTVTRYKALSLSKVTYSEPKFSSTDVPFDLVLTARFIFKSQVSTSSTESIETVTALEPDGTRVVKVERLERVKVGNSQNPPEKSTLVLAYAPGGVVQLRDFAFDAAGLNDEAKAELLERQTLAKAREAKLVPWLYGRSLEPNQAVVQPYQIALSNGTVFMAKTSMTYRGRSAENDLIFNSLTTTEPTSNQVQSGDVQLNFKFEPSKSEGAWTYFADGRLKRSLSASTQRFALTISQTVDGKTFSASSQAVTETSSSIEAQ